MFLVHVTGKRPLVFASLIGCGLCFFATATYAHFLDLVPGSSVDNVVSNLTSFNRTNVLNRYNITGFETSFSTSSDESETTMYAFLETTTFGLDDLLRNDSTRVKRLHIAEEESTGVDPLGELAESVILQLPKVGENQILWLPLALLLSGALLSHVGIRLIPWMLIGEVFPVSVRSGGSGMSSGIGYLFGFFANKLFLGMVANLTLPGTFWIYSFVALGGCAILYFTLPETEGKTLLEIEAYFVRQPMASSEKNNPSDLNMAEIGRPPNGFDQITIIPPSNGSSRITLRLGSIDAGDGRLNESRRLSMTNDNGIGLSEGGNSPRVGSKRFMKSTVEMRRLSSVNTEDSTNM